MKESSIKKVKIGDMVYFGQEPKDYLLVKRKKIGRVNVRLEGQYYDPDKRMNLEVDNAFVVELADFPCCILSKEEKDLLLLGQ